MTVPETAGTFATTPRVRSAPLAFPGDPSASRAREAYQRVAVRLEARARSAPGRAMVVAGVSPGDEATRCAAYLAVAFARLGRNAALVDVHASRSERGPWLGVEARGGVADVLEGHASLDQVAWRLADDHGTTLDVLPFGPSRPHLRVKAAVTLLEALRARYDWVLVDTAPVGESADAAALGRALDGVVLVVRAGATPRAALVAACDALRDVTVAGCVLHAEER